MYYTTHHTPPLRVSRRPAIGITINRVATIIIIINNSIAIITIHSIAIITINSIAIITIHIIAIITSNTSNLSTETALQPPSGALKGRSALLFPDPKELFSVADAGTGTVIFHTKNRQTKNL